MNCHTAARLYIRANGTVPCLDEVLFVLTHTWNRSTKYTSQAQIEQLDEFKVFGGPRDSFSNVNEETDNLTHWEEIGEMPRHRRFTDS